MKKLLLLLSIIFISCSTSNINKLNTQCITIGDKYLFSHSTDTTCECTKQDTITILKFKRQNISDKTCVQIKKNNITLWLDVKYLQKRIKPLN